MNVTNIDNMFFRATLFNLGNLVKQTLVNGITSVQSQSKLVLQTMLVQWMTNQEETKVKCGPPNLWDMSKITDMSELFSNDELKEFNDPIGDWDVRNMVNMEKMFQIAKSFNQPIGEWQTENVTTMESMFSNAKSFNQPIGEWRTENVTAIDCMFVTFSVCHCPMGWLNEVAL